LIRAAVLGAGSWGTALAIHLARCGTEATLWVRRADFARSLARSRENTVYLPGHPLLEGQKVTADLREALRGAELVLFVTPAQSSRTVYRAAAPHLGLEADLVIASKGIEQDSLKRLSVVLAEEAGAKAASRVAVLSGPSFATEVARGDPTAVVVAGEEAATLERIQTRISGGCLRAYRNPDLIGVELAGALKNIMAVATGIVEGLGFGTNTRAALITRGLAEIGRLGTALGGSASTFAGLAGAGDLILTCTGSLSRNRSVGVEIGRGRQLEEVLREMRMVAEGVPTTRAAVALADQHRIDMPIARKVHEILFEGRAAAEAVRDLLARPLREEA
jgi:glycerol-3-phosphate dehydrogenase (NAD(P)+)